MENLEARGMEIPTLLNNISKTSNTGGTGGKYTEKNSEKVYRDEVTPCMDPVVQAAVEESKARLKRLDQDYQRTFRKYREIQSNRYQCYIERKGSEHSSHWVGYCINRCKNFLKQLQNVLDMLNIEQAPQQRTETANHCKKFLMLHGITSLAQERMILKEKAEHKEQNNDKHSPKMIDFRAINWEFHGMQREIPRISSKKHVHDLLNRLEETYKLREKDTIEGAMAGNPTSQDIIRNSTSIGTQLLEKVIKELEKEREEKNNILRDKRKEENGYTVKMKHLHQRKEWLCGKWDDERKYMLGLKNIHDELEYFLPVFLNPDLILV